MKTIKNYNKIGLYSVLPILAFLAVAFSIFFPVNEAKAVRVEDIFDPFCLLHDCDDDDDDKTYVQPPAVNNYTTNYTNTNSNVNSPNSSVKTVDNRVIVNSNDSSKVNVTPKSGYYYAYDGTGGNYDDNEDDLTVRCSVSDTRAEVDERVTWTAYVSGGNGNYTYDWDGTDGISGYSKSIAVRYDDTGRKTASVTVRSGGQRETRSCENSVYIEDNNNDDDYFTVSCGANISSADVNDSVTWRAYISGPSSGTYRYSWDGTDGLDGSKSSLKIDYNRPGQKNAYVTVKRGSVTRNAYCGTINIYDRYNRYSSYSSQYPSSNSSLGAFDVACYPTTNSTVVGRSVTWSAEAIGGYGNYTYTWTGTDGISGSQSVLVTSYFNPGVKTATVTARSGDLVLTKQCGGVISVSQSTGSSLNGSRNSTNNNQGNSINSTTKSSDDDNGLSAASLFAIDNIPWGWVFVLVIIVLVMIIAYLVAQKNKA